MGPYPLREDEQLEAGSGPYSPEEVVLIGKLLKSGDWTQQQIARVTTRNQSTVSRLAKRLGIDATDVQDKLEPARAVLAGNVRTRQLQQAAQMTDQIDRLLLQMHSPILRMKQTSDGTVHTYKSAPSAAEQRDCSISIGVLTDKRSLIMRDQPSHDNQNSIINLTDTLRVPYHAIEMARAIEAVEQKLPHTFTALTLEAASKTLSLYREIGGELDMRALRTHVVGEGKAAAQEIITETFHTKHEPYGISREHSAAIT
jgi:hypothetical protein